MRGNLRAHWRSARLRRVSLQSSSRSGSSTVDVLGHARIRRELLAKHRPVVIHVRGRQHGDRDAARSHATLDFFDDEPPQLQGLEPKHSLWCQPQLREQVPVHERLVRRGIGMDDEHIVYIWNTYDSYLLPRLPTLDRGSLVEKVNQFS